MTKKRMTKKYTAALIVADKIIIAFQPDAWDHESLYSRLQESGYFWNSKTKVWEEHDPADADEPTPLVMLRVWADVDVVEEAADDIAECIKRSRRVNWRLVERSTPYLCRPPKQAEARVYLKFMPE